MHGTDPVMDWDSDFGIHVAVYLSLVFLFFCLLPLCCYYIRVESKTLAKICPPRSCRRRQPRIRPQQRYDIGIGYGMGIGNVCQKVNGVTGYLIVGFCVWMWADYFGRSLLGGGEVAE